MSEAVRCHLSGCPRAATSTCRVCARGYCDQHMLVAEMTGAQGVPVSVEVCFADLGTISQPGTEHGTRVTQWHRKSEPS